jgi:hypothetical protein
MAKIGSGSSISAWAYLKFSCSVITTRISAQRGSLRNGTGGQKFQSFPPRASTGQYCPTVSPIVRLTRICDHYCSWHISYVLWTLQHFEWIFLYLEMKWISDNSKTFSQSFGFLRHTQAEPGIIQSRHKCSVRVGRKIDLRIRHLEIRQSLRSFSKGRKRAEKHDAGEGASVTCRRNGTTLIFTHSHWEPHNTSGA